MKNKMLTLSLLGLVMLSACGKIGPSGPKGDSIVGPQGAPGQDASPVTVVQLCAGTTEYSSSTFVEVAFCVGGKLYGTYSANGGFSTEIVPGSYSSNGINSSCTFTVAENCQVTN